MISDGEASWDGNDDGTEDDEFVVAVGHDENDEGADDEGTEDQGADDEGSDDTDGASDEIAQWLWGDPIGDPIGVLNIGGGPLFCQ